MQLAGPWRAIEADEQLRRVFPQPDLDDGSWAEAAVPGHWRSEAAFAASDGPLLYRHRFEAEATRPERRQWLRLDGLFYQGDVWLDGVYLGDTEGYFFPHTFEISEALRRPGEHVLAVEVTCSPQTDRAAKHNLTGVFQHWDCLDPDWNPGGIWRPVHLEQTGPVRVARLRVLCPEAGAERATLEFEATLDASRAGTATVVTTVGKYPPGPAAAEHRGEHRLAAGDNVVRWRVAVDRPELWWPHALGDQPLYDVAVAVSVDGERSDQRITRTGLRQVRTHHWITTVNGERIFLKGSNHGPTQRALGDATPADFERDIVLAKQAGLDLLRIHAHVSRPELYEAADRHGLLLWQDLPLQWGYANVRHQAVRQAREAVDLLGHHPSIAIWCGHNEPIALDMDTGALYRDSGGKVPAGFALRMGAKMVLPTWNKTVLDRSIKRALEKADGSRPVVAHSGVLPHPAWSTDTHLYFGWYHGDERSFPAALARLPVLAGFVTEFGAQAVPMTADFMEPDRWPDLDWPRLGHHHLLQKEIFDARVPPAEFATFEAWRDATQQYQATVIRYHIEALRRLKYRPTGGFCQFCFADGQPAVTWSVLDHERTPKRGYEALAAACAPVIVVADRPEASYRPGERISLNLHVVNDLREPLPGARLRARLTWPDGERTWWFEGDADADSCARIGAVEMALPDEARDGSAVVLDLELTWAGGKAQNRYDTLIRVRP